MNYGVKFIGFVIRQLLDCKPRKYMAFQDDRGLYYFNEEGERIACLANEITF